MIQSSLFAYFLIRAQVTFEVLYIAAENNFADSSSVLKIHLIQVIVLDGV